MMPAAASELLAFVVEMAMLPVHLCLIQPDAVHLLSPVDRNVCHASQGAPDQLSAEDHQEVTDCAPVQNYLYCLSPPSVSL